jgi:hypothetical protein
LRARRAASSRPFSRSPSRAQPRMIVAAANGAVGACRGAELQLCGHEDQADREPARL